VQRLREGGGAMTQTRLSSLIEAVINVAIGFVVSLLLTALVLPAYGHHVTFAQNLQITAIFTVASIARSYAVRRWFNARIHRAAESLAQQSN
jgi:hypothetical protein